MSVHMRETLKHIANGNAFDELLPLLVGKVFHVTKEQNWPNISASGKLLPLPPRGSMCVHLAQIPTSSNKAAFACLITGVSTRPNLKSTLTNAFLQCL